MFILESIQYEYCKLPSGYSLRIIRARPKKNACKGTVCIFPGRADFLEKYEPLIEFLTSNGFAVTGLDWRGQGGSTKISALDQRGYVNYFKDFLEDFWYVQPQIYPDACGPNIVFGHSMGGHIALRILLEHPDFFQKAVLSAPMTNLNYHGLYRKFIRFMSVLLPTDLPVQKFAFSKRSYDFVRDSSGLSADNDQLQRMTDILNADPNLQLSAANCGWVYAAFNSIDILQEEGAPEGIQTPILTIAGTHDKYISVEQQKAFHQRLPLSELHLIANARHDPFTETPPIREESYNKLKEFLFKKF